MKKSGVDISEVYSPPRVATIAAKRRGLSVGTSFDITTNDENGIPWDLSKKDIQERCRARIMKDKPGLLIGSPMCRDWSQIININWPRMPDDEYLYVELCDEDKTSEADDQMCGRH